MGEVRTTHFFFRIRLDKFLITKSHAKQKIMKGEELEDKKGQIGKREKKKREKKFLEVVARLWRLNKGKELSLHQLIEPKLM